MSTTRPGEWVDNATGLESIRPDQYEFRIPTQRYVSPEFVERERERSGCGCGRSPAAPTNCPSPATGRNTRSSTSPSSSSAVRTTSSADSSTPAGTAAMRCARRDRATPSADSSASTTCGPTTSKASCEGMLRENLAGPIDKTENSAAPGAGRHVRRLHLPQPRPRGRAAARTTSATRSSSCSSRTTSSEFTTVMDVTESHRLQLESRHGRLRRGLPHQRHPSPAAARCCTSTRGPRRYRFFENHSVAMAPFEVVGRRRRRSRSTGIMALPETFPAPSRCIPRFQELVAPYQDEDGQRDFPDGITARMLLQQATRDILTGMGLDVSGLTDAQMSRQPGLGAVPQLLHDHSGRRSHVVMAVPHPDGDPNRCIWHVASYMYLPEEFRGRSRAEPIVVDEPGSYKYFEALQQDYEQMPRQQLGPAQRRLDHMALVKEEVVIAHFHSVVDRTCPPRYADPHRSPCRHRRKDTMNLEESIAHHGRMAEAYRDAYLRQGVQDGEAFATPGSSPRTASTCRRTSPATRCFRSASFPPTPPWPPRWRPRPTP